ncbi:MAG: HAD family phosphatase [Spirochaetales bacterium]|nr:HAD family phosphatase [Spirochaetales bacterium]
MSTIEAVIFDLDGTLIDSEPVYYEADKRLMNELGLPLTEEMKHEFVGCGNLQMMTILKERHRIPDSMESLLERKEHYYLELARKHMEVFPEMKKFVESLAQKGIPMAVASGSGPDLIRELLEQVKLKEYFTELVSSEEVEKGKPHPDVFLLTARKLNIKPERLLVIEDSVYGVLAAGRAGMLCAAIPSILTDPLPTEYYQADLLFDEGMSGFSAAKILAWMENGAPGNVN